ncbi:MAG: HAMP domain-containing histidine kinase [Clostridia bacterium]|nr:HAMP domain-containing histidine kinase [Clostridia bacterium]
MKKSLRFQLSLSSALPVLLTVCLISLSAHFFIQRQFEQYIMKQQAAHAASLAESVSSQYDAHHGGWNLDYLHGFGMYALSDGYIMKVYDAAGAFVWDAENHDMTLCHGVMDSILSRMRQQKPGTNVELIDTSFDLTSDAGAAIGRVAIQYYTPNYAHESDFDFLQALDQLLIYAAIASLMIAVVIGLWMARRIARPITAATQAAGEVSVGHYGVRIPEHTGSMELKTLTTAVNQMAQDLESQEERKRRMTTDVAHELRTPIANISSYLEAMAEGVWEPTTERLAECHQEAQRIAGIVGQLETLHRSEEHESAVQKSSVSVRQLCESAAASFARSLEEREQRCNIAGEDFILPTDKEKLRQVLNNLLSNAIKYSPEGTAITITLFHTEKEAQIRVQDQGIGIPKAEQALIFERFYRTDLSRSRKTGGAGIGLAIAKALTEQLGGRITVESRENEGSAFTVSLPLQ